MEMVRGEGDNSFKAIVVYGSNHEITKDGEAILNEKVEKFGQDNEGSWNELWGTQFDP